MPLRRKWGHWNVLSEPPLNLWYVLVLVLLILFYVPDVCDALCNVKVEFCCAWLGTTRWRRMESRGISLRILSFGTTWEWEVSFLLLIPGKCIRYTLGGTLGGLRPDRCKDDGNLSNNILFIKQIVLFRKRRSYFSFMLRYHPAPMIVYGGIHARVLNVKRWLGSQTHVVRKQGIGCLIIIIVIII